MGVTSSIVSRPECRGDVWRQLGMLESHKEQRDMGHGAAKWGLECDVSDEGCAPVGGVTRRNETLLGQIVTSGYFVSGLGCRWRYEGWGVECHARSGGLMTLEAQKLEKMLTKSLQHHPPSSHNCSQQKLVKNENLKIIRGPHEFDFWAIIH